MQPVPLHTVPFIIAIVVKIIVGALWYSPLLFAINAGANLVSLFMMGAVLGASH